MPTITSTPEYSTSTADEQADRRQVRSPSGQRAVRSMLTTATAPAAIRRQGVIRPRSAELKASSASGLAWPRSASSIRIGFQS